MTKVAVKPITPNERQAEAIRQTDGPVMLLAGPGSGKTFTLIERIKAMLFQGIKPESILCLTFSDAASSEMKSRLVASAGQSHMGASGVKISTYHSFCMDIIRSNPSRFELMDNVDIADEITKRAVVKEILDELEIEYLKDKYGNKYHYVADILGAINTVKRERIGREEYFEYLENNEDWLPKLEAQMLDVKEREEKGKPTKTAIDKLERQEKKIGKAQEFYNIYELYEKKLKSVNLIDFADMINLVIEALEVDEDFLKEAAGDIKYILVDEYQDTNSSQNSLIFLVAKGASTENVFVVGDDDQIIYSFQGARCDNLKNFLHKYPHTKVICLNENNRSAQTILDFAGQLIEGDPSRLQNDAGFEKYNISKKLTAKNDSVIKKEKKIEFCFYEEKIQENNAIVSKIESLAKETKLSEIAVLCRQHGEINEIAKLLEAKNIPFITAKAKSVFEIPAFILTYFYLKAIESPNSSSDKLFGLLTSEPFSISDKDYVELLVLHRKNNRSFFENAKNIENSEELQKFLKIFESLRREKSYKGLYNFILEVINRSGIMAHYSESFENLAALKRLLKEVNAFQRMHKGAALKEFLTHIETYLNENIAMEIEQDITLTDAVCLLTYHASKGREFEHVFMPSLTSRAWEESRNSRGIDLPFKQSTFDSDPKVAKMIENLKLLFVGITRSKFGLYLSLANANEGKTQTLSTYFTNILNDEDLVASVQCELSPADYINELKKFLMYAHDSNEMQRELEERTRNLVVSASGLNQYLSCPQKYYWGNILNIPVFKEDVDKMSFGSALHKMYERGYRLAMEKGVYPVVEELIEIFNEKILTLEFSSDEKREQYKLRGEKAIREGYKAFSENNIEHIAAVEERFELMRDGYELKGFVDFIRQDNDGKYYLVDFKTGSKRPIKEDSDYHNQLKFYKYLFEKVNPDKKVGDCSLVFIENNFSNVPAELVEWDMEDIEKKISAFVSGAKAFKFEPTLSKDSCMYCNYRLICKLACSQ